MVLAWSSFFVPYRFPGQIVLVVCLLLAVGARADTAADFSSPPVASATSPPIPESDGIRPDHLWTVDYVELLWSDTGWVLTAPLRWDEQDWMYVGFFAAGIGAAISLDQTIKDHVQAHRTASEDRFFSQYENFGATWSFGVIGAFEIWGEVGGDTRAKNAAMDALTASIIGPGLIGTSPYIDGNGGGLMFFKSF